MLEHTKIDVEVNEENVGKLREINWTQTETIKKLEA